MQPVIEQLQAGEVLGDRLSGLNIVVFKVRVKNSDIQKGKSAGYRLIYQVETSTRVILQQIPIKPATKETTSKAQSRYHNDETN